MNIVYCSMHFCSDINGLADIHRIEVTTLMKLFVPRDTMHFVLFYRNIVIFAHLISSFINPLTDCPSKGTMACGRR